MSLIHKKVYVSNNLNNNNSHSGGPPVPPAPTTLLSHHGGSGGSSDSEHSDEPGQTKLNAMQRHRLFKEEIERKLGHPPEHDHMIQRRDLDRTSPDSSTPVTLTPPPGLGLRSHYEESGAVGSCPLCKVPVRDLPQHLATAHTEIRPGPAPPVSSSSPPQVLNLTKMELDTPVAPPMSPRDAAGFLPRDSPALTVIKRCIGEQSPQLPSPPPAIPMNLTMRKDCLPNQAMTSPEELAKVRALYQARFFPQTSTSDCESASSSLGSVSGDLSPGKGSMSSALGPSPPIGLGEGGGPVVGSAAAAAAASQLVRKRRKQTHVPEQNKDERYWARRLKNNEAAKRSRDMRIKREKLVFEENARLEKMTGDLRADLDALATENKELQLKMDIIMEENMRLKSVLLTYQNRRSSIDNTSSASTASSSASSPPSSERRRSSAELKPFPFPAGN